MNNSLKKIQAWRSRRQLRSLERWEQIRAEGKARFVVRTGLTYGLTVVGLTHAYESFFYGTQSSIYLVKLIIYLLIGFYMGTDAWSTMEGKYKNALIKARVKASPTGKLPPHDSPLQITADLESR